MVSLALLHVHFSAQAETFFMRRNCNLCIIPENHILQSMRYSLYVGQENCLKLMLFNNLPKEVHPIQAIFSHGRYNLIVVNLNARQSVPRLF